MLCSISLHREQPCPLCTALRGREKPPPHRRVFCLRSSAVPNALTKAKSDLLLSPSSLFLRFLTPFIEEFPQEGERDSCYYAR